MLRLLYVQIALLFSLILILIMISFGWMVGNSQSVRLKEAMTNEVSGLGSIYGDIVARYLVVDDLAAMEEALVHAAQTHGLKTVAVLRPDGGMLVNIVSKPGTRPVITYGSGSLLPPLTALQVLVEENGDIVVWEPMTGGSPLGWLRISKGMETISRLQQQVWQGVTVVGAVGMVAGVLLIIAVLWRPVRALQRIRDFAFDLNRNKGKQIVEDHSSQEMLELCRSLNQASGELAETERILLEERERLGVTLESIGDGVVACDRQGRIQLMNRVAGRLTGWETEQAKGLMISDVLHLVSKDSMEKIELGWHEIVTAGSVKELEAGAMLVAKDGERRNLADSMAPIIDRSGDIAGFVMVFRDVTEQLVMESRQEALQEQLRHSQKMEAVGQLAGGIAHDFNNILTAIIGYSEILREMVMADARARDCADRILQASERAAGLTRSLLAFSRKQKMEVKRFDLNAEILNIEKILRRIIGEDVELRISLSHETLVVNGDPGQIDQVLINLATNARDAMPSGGLLSIQSSRVLGSPDESEEPIPMALIAVSDTGQGIDPSLREKIFDPFFTTKEVGKGTGLGLSIVDGIIRQHQGSIDVYSEIGIGTSFKIFIPLGDGGDEIVVADQSCPPGGNETILLVEDEDDVRQIARNILEKAGYRVIEASNGIQALHRIASMGDRINLLLTDVIMPRMNGRDLADKIRSQFPSLRVLYMSGYTWDVIEFKGILEKGGELISKPFDTNLLLRRVRETLDRNRS